MGDIATGLDGIHWTPEGAREAARRAAAALARASVAGVVKAAVLHSESEASWTDTKSTGSAFSNGVELGLFQGRPATNH